MKTTKNGKPAPEVKRCAIYTRKSTSAGLEQDFNSLDAQRDSCTGYIQRQPGWKLVEERYDDGGFTGANIERPAFQRLLADIDAGKIDVVVVYKVDRLSRSLLDFAKVMERFGAAGASFVSVTQNFSTADAMGRLTLNMLMSFASSTDAAYLVWRVRQAQKGRIKVGPIERGATGEAAGIKVLPLRMTAAEVEALDAGWRRLGFKSRTAMLKKAIEAMLA